MSSDPEASPAAEHDVVIVGSGVAGALIGARLASVGLKVLILEAGPETDRETTVIRFRRGEEVYESPEWAPQPARTDPDRYYVQAGSVPFTSDYERRVGGTTWHWLGTCPRLLPSDFQMQTRFGVGVDWPIAYEDLEPWYGEAERELGVAGDSEVDDGSPRSTPFPLPPLPLSSGDVLYRDAAANLGLAVTPIPQARNSIDGYQGRPVCCGNATCIPVCPIQAKYDATVHIAQAVDSGAELRPNAVAHRIEVDANGLVAGIHYLDPHRTDHLVTARTYVIAANAIETPKLLLLSMGDHAPNGVANASDQVGRNLCDHPFRATTAMLPMAYAGSRGPLVLAGISAPRDSEDRDARAAFSVELVHSVGNPLVLARSLIADGLAGTALVDAILAIAPYQATISSMAEQLPAPENRIVPDPAQVDALGIPRPHITYAHDAYTLAGLDDASAFHHQLLDVLGASDRGEFGPGGAGHIMGTCRMGSDPATSVTDPTGRTHDHPNLFLAGSSLFPTCGTANPTLTLAALALRTAGEIAVDFGVTTPATLASAQS